MSKVGKFFIKWIDAFILRIPFSYLVLVLALQVAGVEERQFTPRLLSNNPILLVMVFLFAIIWSLIYASVGKRRFRGFIIVLEVLYCTFLGYALLANIQTPQRIVPFIKSLGTAEILLALWTAYMIVSEIIKGKIARRQRNEYRNSRKPEGNFALQSFMQLTDTALTLSAMGRVVGNKGYKRPANANVASSKPQRTHKPVSNQKNNTSSMGSGAKTEGEFHNLLRKKGYEIFKLRNKMVLVIANSRVYILRYVKEQGEYSQEDGKWYKDGNFYADMRSELASVEQMLKSDCKVGWVKALVMKTFKDGKVPGSKELKYADVSENYDSAEAVILKQIPLNRAEKKHVSATSERVKSVFKDRMAAEGGER